MKHGEVIRRVNRIAKAKGLKAVYTEGAKHTHVVLGARWTTIPRHSDINEYTARAILDYLAGGDDTQEEQ